MLLCPVLLSVAPAQVDCAKMNEVSVKLLQDAVEKGQENVCFSVAGLCEVLAPVVVGTAGNTRKEIEGVFGDLTALSKGSDSIFGKDLKSFNIAFIDRRLDLTEQFKQGLSRSIVHKVDFLTEAEKVCQRVNDFVKDKTEGLINEVVHPEDINENSCLAVVNALLFKGSWYENFDVDDGKRDFFFGRSEKIPVMMMSDIDFSSRYVADQGGCTVLMKPYQDVNGKRNGKYFVVFMPNQESLHDFIQNLSMKKIDDLMGQTVKAGDKGGIVVKLPRFSIECLREDMVERFKKMGIRDLFDSYKADFSGIAKNAEGVYMSILIQSCRLMVDEAGTVAAAVTVAVDPFAGPSAFPVLIEINRPFVWMIYDENRKLILFCGTLDKPKDQLPPLKEIRIREGSKGSADPFSGEEE